MLELFGKKRESKEPCPSVFLTKNPLKMTGSVYYYFEDKLAPLDGERYYSIFRVLYLDHLFFEDERFYFTLKSKTQKELEKEIPHQMSLWARAMFSQEYHLAVHPKLLIKKIDSIMGYGVLALQDIAQYSYIGEYTGIVRKRSKRKDQLNDYVFGFPVCNKDSSFVIDAKNYGNYTRFINHSDDPNLFSRWMEKDGVCHVILYANRLIPKGDQLTYDYGPLYWRKRPAPIERM